MKRYAFLLIVGFLACAPRAKGPFDDPVAAAAADAEGGVVLAVRNQNFLDMTIYILENSGPRRRLGVAGGNHTSYFNIPKSWIITRELRFLADPIGSTGNPVSDKVLVEPGDSLFLTIPPQ